MFSALFCLLLGQGALSYEHRITTVSELITFSNNVNSGISYSGTTMFLGADIDFSGGLSEQFEPIGNSSSKSFQGTFDGQGHTISNLAMNSSSQYIGLFGNSKGATIKNVVLDDSCPVVSSCGGLSYVGGIIGMCETSHDPCTIESTVNMASVSFTGSTSNRLYFGGIVGYLSASNKEATVRNCANYGSVTHSGTAVPRIGGIIGYSVGDSTKYIQNCFNYGTITHNGTTSGSLYLGGILGCVYKSNSIESCVSAGKITSSTVSDYTGSIIGYIDSSSSTTINHCYWTSDVGNYNVSGYNKTAAIEIVLAVYNETKEISLNAATIDSLNNYNSSWSMWLLNTNKKPITFKVNNGKGFNLSSQLILIPSITESENHTFSGWFEDEECTKKFTGSSVEAEITLYGRWSYVLTFDPTGGVATTSSKSVVYGQKYGELPDTTRTGYAFAGWFTEKVEGKGEKVTENDTVTKGFDHTLYAHWTGNNYTVTLNVNGGDTLPTNEFIVTYNKPYNCLPNATRTGHTFNGWFTDGGTEVNNETTANITADNHTLYAHWTINNYTLAFDYGNGTVDSRTISYNDTINYPNAAREGFAFNGWKPKPERMPANDTTVVAQWIENATFEVIKIVFNKKDMTKEEVTEIIKGFTKENFTIKEFEANENDLVVIIRFDDAIKAKNFVEAIADNDNKSNLFIESISFLSEPLQSMATGLQLPSIFGLFFLLLLFILAHF